MDTSLAENANVDVRVCPEHGQFWREQDRPDGQS